MVYTQNKILRATMNRATLVTTEMWNGMQYKAPKLLLLLTLIFSLAGCDQMPENPEQMAFLEKIRNLKSEKDHLDGISFRGTDESGKIAPADIEEQANKNEYEILQLLKESPLEVVQWSAKVSNIVRSDEGLIIHSFYGSQHYDLIIFDSQAVKIAENFIEDDLIKFSGNLGPEQSSTIFGALSSQDFSLYPTNIISTHGEIKQSQAEINEKLSIKKEQLIQQEKQNQKESEEDQLKDKIIDLCKSTIRSSLKYPESASFSWFKRNFVKKSESEWLYYDVLEAKNDFGGELPTRFECDAKVIGEKLEASVRFLDGVE